MNVPQSLRKGQILTGPLFNEPRRVEMVRSNGPDTSIAGLVGARSERYRKVTLTSQDLEKLVILDTTYGFDGDGRFVRLAIQAYSLGIAYEFNPYLGLSISRVDPLPNQLEAVYDYLLRLARVRFLLAKPATHVRARKNASRIEGSRKGPGQVTPVAGVPVPALLDGPRDRGSKRPRVGHAGPSAV